MNNTHVIPYGRQTIDQSDIDSVVDTLRSDWLTQGPALELFEKALSTYCAANYAVAMSSATAALHVAYLALGLGTGDLLWTTPNTFVATSNAALMCGAKVDFVDIDQGTYNISVVELEKKLIAAEKAGSLPKIVVPVHFAGLSCPMREIWALSIKYGFKVVEDASHAIGGTYEDRPVGICRYSDITVFSFHPVKIVTTGEGGAATTNNFSLAERMFRLRSHGVIRDPKKMKNTTHGPWYYEQIELAPNYRLTDIQASLGRSQLKRIDAFVKHRERLSILYDCQLRTEHLILPPRTAGTKSSWHLYVVQLKKRDLGRSRLDLFNALRLAGIGVNVHYIPVHMQPYYRDLGFSNGDFPNAEQYYENTITLPIYAGLSEDQQRHVICKINEKLDEF